MNSQSECCALPDSLKAIESAKAYLPSESLGLFAPEKAEKCTAGANNANKQSGGGVFFC